MNWLRDVALAVVTQRREGDWLIANDLLEIIDADGSIELPGLKAGNDLNDLTRNAVRQHIGRRLGQCFRDQDRVELDRLVIDRECTLDALSRPSKHYRICQNVSANFSPDAPSEPQNISGVDPHYVESSEKNLFDDVTRESQNPISPDNSPDSPLMTPLMISRVSPDSPDVSNALHTRGRVHTHDPLLNVLRDHQGISGFDVPAESSIAATNEPRETLLI